ncbi:undecaprenyldiphospho-muramoylpentapeptide beta-N-acetylglucosaminyltransferase [Microcoleus sp. FACHB-68]|uniref:undecaprenyldiphospho-muramoylpentapeptide beta-N-acetylglucosaminyltransferase n=1 Tax=Microcoleus sp. FACHB-68 TaxID=2692826 RepID=UPI0016880B3D|nr:undecaprenyldiphospho-muramoylpentapeptide beta-N-acetylglucosaminyltransferase [Microcoleus sp. FACHB-68]MBD1936560.1 undecaprenyldiphospho-muramoylpentapeptide beta-N-acetylglucosaminyltransferase [Microcoleus sp. FACHB-68]
MVSKPVRLLIAASGTGGHLFPATALAEQLSDYEIEWLGVPNRLETQLVPEQYPLHTIGVEGFQQRGLGSLRVLSKLLGSVRQVRRLLVERKFQGVFTTGGYIAAPAIIAARSLGLPVILHESNGLPGKVTRWFSPWCTAVAIGFESAAQYLPKAKTVYVGTPVRLQFLSPQPLDLAIPEGVPVIVVAGGSQGAVALNKLVRQCAKAWFDAGAWIVHQTGENDPEAGILQHPQYFSMPFYSNMAGLFQRANLAISRAGAGTLTELAVTQTPSILVPYPFAAEDHQAYNAAVFAGAGAAVVCRQGDLTPEVLEDKVLDLLNSPARLQKMAECAGSLAIPDSSERLGKLVRRLLEA